MTNKKNLFLFYFPSKFREADLHSPEWTSSALPAPLTTQMSDAPVESVNTSTELAPAPIEAPSEVSELMDVKKEERPISLRVQDQQGGQVHFKVKFSTPMRKIFDMYAQKRGVAVNVLRFMLDGRRIRPEDTAASLDLEDNDQIDCLLEQIGGDGGLW